MILAIQSSINVKKYYTITLWNVWLAQLLKLLIQLTTNSSLGKNHTVISIDAKKSLAKTNIHS